MIDHHIQRSIIYRLALVSDLRFSDLKPDTIENKLFTYHLKKVIAAGYAQKNPDGLYSLTSEGRRLGLGVLESMQAWTERAYSVLFLVIRRKSDGAWLLYKRNRHPLIEGVGFMNCSPLATENIAQTAASACKKKTNLECSFTVLGSGFFRVYEQQLLESFTHFTLLVCEDAQGELVQDDPYADYFWEQTVPLTDPNILPNMSTLVALYEAKEPFFIERTFTIKT